MMNFETWVVVTKGFEVPLDKNDEELNIDRWGRNVKKKLKQMQKLLSHSNVAYL